MSDAIKLAIEALNANDLHRLEYDEFNGYLESELR